MTTITEVQQEIEALGSQVAGLKEKLLEARRKLPREEVRDYEFQNWNGGITRLSELFGGRTDLIVVHNMGKGCVYCTLWADGLNGFVKPLEDRAAFVVVSPNPPDVQKPFAASRGWKFKMVSSEGDTFTQDMGFFNDAEGYWPGFSTFTKDPDGKIYRIGKAIFGPGDEFCAVWPMFDLLADGVNDWEPKYDY
jgi:predicted dithiol-disulfide oxidoreductase (DUF899 family)